MHLSELEHCELLPVESDPPAAEQHRPAALESDDDREAEEERRKENEENCCAEPIEDLNRESVERESVCARPPRSAEPNLLPQHVVSLPPGPRP